MTFAFRTHVFIILIFVSIEHTLKAAAPPEDIGEEEEVEEEEEDIGEEDEMADFIVDEEDIDENGQPVRYSVRLVCTLEVLLDRIYV